ncbi:hypothetical protein SBOR_2027 [Sclerotinia borealis F-4128]|uniref:DUF7730 domain-containing protein n=1 Tax=Sclerotinia borealis (strain F-4128) TaxID=1432307 RepID=W9CSU1_SCLBF|nr:hypothetical protein SBOR_2027 [Sclerotinia borealis F-4128]
MPPRLRKVYKKCHLLSLPREIRDKISRYVQWGQLNKQSNARLSQDHNKRPHDMIMPRVGLLFEHAQLQEIDPERRFQPDSEDILILARTCEQLYDESIEIFFGENTFSFIGCCNLYCYLYMIGTQRRACLRRVHFHFAGCQTSEAFQLLGECKALRSLQIAVSRQTMSSSRQPQRDLMTARGASALRKIRGMENLVVEVVEGVRFYRGRELSPYFEPEHIQAFASTLAEEMRMVEVSEKDQGGSSERKLHSKSKSEKSKPTKLSGSRSLRSGRVQKSRRLPMKKVAEKAKVNGKRE